jgi:tRNA pseudouridine32 synthase/23S rRNA pseudouridine746 synthase
LHAYSLHFNYLGQQYVFQQRPMQGAEFNDEVFTSLVSQQWLQPDNLAWPTKK